MNVGFRLPSGVETEPAERTFDVRQYLHFVWRHWMFIASVTALVFVIGVVYLARTTPLYTATAQVLLERPAKAPTDTGSTDYGFGDYSFIENQLAIIRSDPLLRRVVVKERLAEPRPTAKEAQSTDAGKESPAAAEEQSILDAINSLRGALAVTRSGQALVLSISITSTDPAKAAQLANAVANAYVVNQLDARFESAKEASAWLSDRLVELRQQLRDSEEAVTKFRNEHGLIRTGPTIALNDQQLAELNSKLIAARTDVAEKKTRVDFLADVAKGKKTLESLPDTFQSAGVMSVLRGKLADASQREADLLARYSSRHPAVVTVDAEKRDIERSIVGETQRMVQAVNNEYALAKARLSATEQAMREATGQGGLSYDDAVRLRELERTAAVNKSLFEDVLQKAKITDEQSTFRPREARVIMPAQKGGQTSPNVRKALLIALFSGLALGVGGAIAMEKLNAGFTTPRQAEDALGVPVLASVHRMDDSKLLSKDGKAVPLVFYHVHHPLSPFSEAIRALRSGIHMSDVDRPPKVIHVPSSRPGEGKTTIAISLAISAAFSGLKVALVDADLRHPSLSRFFKLEREKGLVDLLVGTTSSEPVLRFQKDLKLTVIPAGSKSLNPTDLLGSERMRALVSHLSETFDYVVLDTPPVGPVVDPVIVAHLADKTIFVVQWASTPRELI